jgi:hypothetical protein
MGMAARQVMSQTTLGRTLSTSTSAGISLEQGAGGEEDDDDDEVSIMASYAYDRVQYIIFNFLMMTNSGKRRREA